MFKLIKSLSIIISTTIVLSTSSYTAQAYKYCDEQLAPSDTKCQIDQGRGTEIVSSNPSYRITQVVAVKQVVPSEYQEKMLFDSDYYDRVRYCILGKGGTSCYNRSLSKGKGLTEGQKEALPAIFTLLSIPLIYIVLSLVHFVFNSISNLKKKEGS